jgi:hypothetical protein
LGIGSRFQFGDALMAAASSISIARISLRLSERRVAEHGHDLVRRAAVVGHSTTESFPQAVGLAIDRQSGGFDRMPHELRKTGRSERPSECSVDDRNVIARNPRYFRLSLRL